jgi:group I intron endonuclease
VQSIAQSLNYGHSNFSLEILEYCEPENAVSREQYYIDLLKPKYNILPTAGSSLGFKHSKESLLKISEANKGENHPFFGKTHTEESLAKLSEAKKGVNHPLFGKTASEETRAKMSPCGRSS